MITKYTPRKLPQEIIQARKNKEEYIKRVTVINYQRNWVSKGMTNDEFVNSTTLEQRDRLWEEAVARAVRITKGVDIREFIDIFE